MKRPTIPVRDSDLKTALDDAYNRINSEEFIASDPVQFPHRYRKKQDIEIAAFLAAAIAWGRRDMIIRSCERMFSLMKPGPYEFIMSGGEPQTARTAAGASRDFSTLGAKCIHRTFFEDDLKYFCRGLKACYAKHESLESLFASAGNIWNGMAIFRETIACANKGIYSKHIADPDSSSACKKFNLALRWLVRREGPVDLGIWKKISPASLFIPLDVHVGRVARQLGLLDPARKSNDKKAVLALTEKLREFCPEDPVKYDYALFGMGVTENREQRAENKEQVIRF